MQNFLKNNKKAFTIIELMVVIILIMIIILGINSLNFNKMSNEQKSEIFANKIISLIEKARDDSLTGKGLYDDTSNTGFKKISKRQISFNNGEDFKIQLKNLDNNNNNNNNILEEIKKIEKEKIEGLYCGNNEIDEFEINFEGSKTTGTCTTTNNISTFNIIVSYNNEKNEIVFDPVSGLVKKCKNNC